MSSAKCHLTSHAPDQPNDPVTVCRELASDRHEIDDLSDTRLGHEAGDQDRGIREVDLLAGEDVHGRATRKCPPRSWSSSAPKTLGESNRGAQNQSMDPSTATSAAVWRSSIRPWSATSG
jgi:hypothetical protein